MNTEPYQVLPPISVANVPPNYKYNFYFVYPGDGIEIPEVLCKAADYFVARNIHISPHQRRIPDPGRDLIFAVFKNCWNYTELSREWARDNSSPISVIAIVEESVDCDFEAILRSGFTEIITLPCTTESAIEKIQWALEVQTRSEVDCLRSELISKCGTDIFVGNSDEFRSKVRQIPLISRSDASVLISGETGTGKELFARAIHYLGPRFSKPFVPVNSGSIPDNLFENEFFGHSRGAYTTASETQKGLLAESNGGTLFLDELNSFSPATQVKLLRFLEDKKYRPLGSSKQIQTDVRIISGTNIDLAAEVERGAFRLDLYHRVNVIRLHLPALREKAGDIPILAGYFLDKYAHRNNRTGMKFTEKAIEKLSRYEWPGNVRQLEHVIERTVVLSERSVIGADDVDVPSCASPLATVTFKEAKRNAVSVFEAGFLRAVLEKHHGNISEAARELQKDRRSVQRMIKKYGLEAAAFL